MVSRLQTGAAAAGDAAGAELSAVARELADRSDANASAMREVEALLA